MKSRRNSPLRPNPVHLGAQLLPPASSPTPRPVTAAFPSGLGAPRDRYGQRAKRFDPLRNGGGADLRRPQGFPWSPLPSRSRQKEPSVLAE